MRRLALLFVALTFAAVLVTGCLQGEKQPPPSKMDSLGWWPTKAELQPKADPRSDMSGQWWWPTDRASEQDALWGNRGFVYVMRRTGRETTTDNGTAKLPTGLKGVEALVFEDVNFDFDKSDITPAGKAILDTVVTALNKYPEAMVTLEGHTCSIGTEEYNMGLGMRRAKAVKDYLVSQGIDAARLTTVSYGETRLKYPEHGRADFARNRRVEFKVSVPEEIE